MNCHTLAIAYYLLSLLYIFVILNQVYFDSVFLRYLIFIKAWQNKSKPQL